MKTFSFSNSTARDGSPVSRAGLVLGLTLLAILSAFGMLLMSARSQERAKASITTANLSAALSEHLVQTIDLYDLALQGTVAALGRPDVMGTDPALRRMVLFDRFATAPLLSNVAIMDAKGDLLFDLRSPTPERTNYADRTFFKAQALNPDLGLFISEPFRGRSTKRLGISLSRRFTRPDGSFGGVVSATLDLDGLHQMFARMSLGGGGSITLYRTDGTLIMREPYDEAAIGRLVRPTRLFHALAEAPEGEYEAVASLDGIARLTHYQRVGQSSLAQTVALSITDIYASWWRMAVQTSLVLAAACGAILSLALILRRELRRRTQAETALASLAGEDPLTKLANRRTFDAALMRQLDDAAGLGAAMSLLMIDADHFKAYNDTFGHPAGDAVLVAVAGVLAHHAQRNGGLAVRYGGEEFAVILPGKCAADALRVAEAIRSGIRELGLSSPGPHGVVTVSIGVSSLSPGSRVDAPRLVHMADKALYDAKTLGRNRAALFRDAASRGRRFNRAA